MLEFLARYARRAGNAEARDRVLAHARADGARRHPRPSRRRLRALFGRRALARAAFREDALRQRPAAGALRRCFAAETGSALFRFAAEGIVAWLVREMVTPEGAFASSLDADSEGVEGKFYVWSAGRDPRRARRRRRPLRPRLRRHRSTATGRRPTSSTGCVRAGATIRRWKRGSPRMRDTLLAHRAGRIRPGLDDKVLADWNGLMIAALVRAALALERPEWIELAQPAFAFVGAQMSRGDSLGHSWRAGQLIFPGFALDHAAMMRAALALHEATGEAAYLDRARAWRARVDARLPRHRHRHPRHDGRERRRARRSPAALARRRGPERQRRLRRERSCASRR